MWNKFIDDWKNPVEYIDREAANLAFAEQGFDWDKAKQALASVPAADVAPVVHGRWIEKTVPEGCRYFECSNCGAHENRHTAIKGYYCWRCGAKMDRGADND